MNKIINLVLFAFLLIGSVQAGQIFSDGFESGGMTGWSLNHAAGAVDWTASTTSPHQGSYHAFGRPIDADDPACTMERTISTLGYNTMNFSYYRKLNLGTALHTFRAKWYDGSTWIAVEDVTGTIADASYVSKSFLLPSNANNNPSFAIKFECTEGTTTKDCNVDNINITGAIIDITAPEITIFFPINNSYSSDSNLDINYIVSDANLQACWYSNDTMSVNITLANCANITNIIWDEGQHNVKIWANDSAGNINSNLISFIIDTINPILAINSPLNQNYNTNSVLVNISASDTNLGSIWFYNGSINLSYSYGYYLFNQGSNTIIAYANDFAGNLNNASIIFFVDSVAPVVNIILPQEGASYGYNNSISLNHISSDTNLQSCWYNLDNGANISLSGCSNTTFNIAEGSHVIRVYANDSFGNLGSDSNSFSVNVGAPTVILNSPIDSYLNNGNNILFSYTPTDIDLDYCELWGDFDGEFRLNQTDDSPISGSANIFNLNLNDGTYLWNIRCVDNVSHSAFNGNKTFYVDTINPSISLTQPTGTKTSRTGISANWQISDANLNSCWYNVYKGASPEVSSTFVNCSVNSATFSVTVDADFIFNFYVNDSAGNINSANLSFSVDTSTPTTPPSGGSGGSSGGGGGGGMSNLTYSNIKRLQVSLIGNIIAREGDKKTLSLNVKNTGKTFLNNCRLIAKGDISSWIYSSQKQGIAPGEIFDFVFDLNVPEGIDSRDYSGELEIKCDEVNDVQKISISIPTFKEIKIGEMIQEGKILTMSYSFDSSNFIGKSVEIDVWINDEAGNEVKRTQDKFDINEKGLAERTIKIDVNGLSGIYYVNFALSSNLKESIRQSIILGKSSSTGFAIFDTSTGKNVIYSIFALIIIFTVLFIWIRQGKIDNSKPVKNKWLLRKKAIISALFFIPFIFVIGINKSLTGFVINGSEEINKNILGVAIFIFITSAVLLFLRKRKSHYLHLRISPCLKNLINKTVYNYEGIYLGKVKDVVLGDSKIETIKIKFSFMSRRRFHRKGISIKYKVIDKIGDVIILKDFEM